jgi:hypothetical protein
MTLDDDVVVDDSSVRIIRVTSILFFLLFRREHVRSEDGVISLTIDY